MWSDKNMCYLQGNYCHRNDIFLLGFFDRTSLFFVVYKESIIEYLKTKENSKLKNKELFKYYLSFTNFGIEFNELSKLGDIIDYDSEYQRLSYLDLISRFYNIQDDMGL